MSRDSPKLNGENSQAALLESGDESEQKAEQDLTAPELLGSSMPRREQFGSILDYLEAKYVRGVMIDDLDERLRQKKKSKRQNAGEDNTNHGSVDDIDTVFSDSEASGSCYSDESGNFLDDSELKSEVAHQLMASSAYGATMIEKQAANRKKQLHGTEAEKNGIANNTDRIVEGIYNDDDAFFVNIGDLEMEEGWEDAGLDENEDEEHMGVGWKGKKG